MVEVVGTAPTSVMFITKFVYRHSWKTNNINIKLLLINSITKSNMKLLKTLVEDQENDKSLYSSGPYWNYKNKRTLSEIKEEGTGRL